MQDEGSKTSKVTSLKQYVLCILMAFTHFVDPFLQFSWFTNFTVYLQT